MLMETGRPELLDEWKHTAKLVQQLGGNSVGCEGGQVSSTIGSYPRLKLGAPLAQLPSPLGLAHSEVRVSSVQKRDRQLQQAPRSSALVRGTAAGQLRPEAGSYHSI